MSISRFRWIVLTAVATLSPAVALADVKPNGVFADHMVLQRDARIPVWGMADAGESVTVKLGQSQASAAADASGKWRVDLDSQPAGGPVTLDIAGKNKITFNDVLVGDVWLCSGQSNMAFSMGWIKNNPKYADDLTSANFPQIRQGLVPRKASREPIDSADVKWTVCSPDTVGDITAAGFYFAREINRELKIPIGLVHSSWGGTSAESWTSIEQINTVPSFKTRADEQWKNMDGLQQQIKDFPEKIAAWEKKYDRFESTDIASHPAQAAIDADTSDWKTIKLGTPWRDAGVPDGGVIWLRKELVIPEASAGKGFHVDYGAVSEQYVTSFFNGEKVGESGRKPPGYYSGYTSCDVPGKLVRSGKNVLSIRFVSATGDHAGTTRNATTMGLRSTGATGTSGALNDEVQMKVERAFAPLPKGALAERPQAPSGDAAHTSGYLFAGMIHPLIPYAIKGALWYQGEQDGSRGFAYRKLLPLMINDWRARWSQPSLPFYVQQLPNWSGGGADGTGWAELREAQWLTAKNVPDCYISCAIDVGDSDNVHPTNKREVGHRLALTALAHTYGKSVVCTGPRFDSIKVEGASLRVSFTDADGLKTTDGKTPQQFRIAGEDKNWLPADARIDGSSVVVSSGKVPAPVAVRYAFVNDPVGANLTNASGLPALPFRSDTWPISSEQRP